LKGYLAVLEKANPEVYEQVKNKLERTVQQCLDIKKENRHGAYK